MNPPPNDVGQYAIGLYVINLDSSTLPMPLDVPFRHELIGFTVFRSRALEDGRERFFLHLGYFESVRFTPPARGTLRSPRRRQA